MVMRSRGGGGPRRGARRGGVRPVHEDFRPTSEWQQDDESHILNIHLPGFTKEEIEVSTEGRNTIRVCGKRLVAGNNWSRFLEDFQVPENGEMSSVRAKFQGGVLNVVVRKKQVDKPHEALTPKPKINDINTGQPADETQELKTLATKQGLDGDNKQTTPHSAIQSSENKSFESQKASERGQNSDQRGASVAPFRNTGIAVSRDSEKKSEPKVKNIASDDLTSNIVNNEKLPEVVRATDIPGRKADNKELSGAIVTKEKYKKSVKGLAELNEERQLLVNMGVAMLVIVALTATVTYKFASGNDKN
ncbi:hypothetical protein CASFOL_024675 [Castilleja foliolosa]|uniref:SHSP domain-containing protein n=1 Tax=Castilleja foliolosa TaxID=1961234 RepID=A0ABD3CS55_9LAMI